jgi:hypothetical protein
MTLDDDQKRRSDECWENDWDYLDGVEGAISIHKDKMPPEPDHQTQLKELVNLCLPAGPTKNSIQRVPIKELTVEPLCSLEEANKNFHYCPAKISEGHPNPLKISMITHGRGKNDLN